MKSYKGTHVAMIGVGFLLEYIFPCVRQLVGEENVAACVMGTSAETTRGCCARSSRRSSFTAPSRCLPRSLRRAF